MAMGLRPRVDPALIDAVLVGACQAGSETEAQVREAAEALLAATLRGDAESVIGAYLPYAPVAQQGVMTPELEQLAPGLRAFYAAPRVLSTALDTVRVCPPAPVAARRCPSGSPGCGVARQRISRRPAG